MSSLNKVMLIGNLGADPEVKTTASGQVVANFSLATNESYTDKGGQKVDKGEWHRVVLWGKLAELAGQYLRKGRKVYIEGKIQSRSWDKPDGTKGYATEIIASQMVFIDSDKGGDRGERNERPSAPAPASYSSSGPPPGPPGGFYEEVPF